MRCQAVFAVCLSFALTSQSAGGEPILIGHRGLLRHAPENTMPALAMASRAKRGPTMIAINLKGITLEGERQLVSTVAEHGLLNESFAFDQDDACSRRLKACNPAFRIGQNVGRKDFDNELAAGDLDVLLLTFVPTPEDMSRVHQKKKVALFNFSGPGPDRRNPAIWDRIKEAGCDGMLTDFPLECRLHWRNQE